LKVKFKRWAENEERCKVNKTDNVNTASSAIPPVSLTQIGYNATDKDVNAVISGLLEPAILENI
jgi:hypothetical protein